MLGPTSLDILTVSLIIARIELILPCVDDGVKTCNVPLNCLSAEVIIHDTQVMSRCRVTVLMFRVNEASPVAHYKSRYAVVICDSN